MMDEYFDLTGHWNFVSSFTGSSKFINRAWAGLKFSQASSCKAAALGVSCHRNIQCLIASMASNRWHKPIGLWVIFESYSCPFSSSVEPCKRWRAFWRWPRSGTELFSGHGVWARLGIRSSSSFRKQAGRERFGICYSSTVSPILFKPSKYVFKDLCSFVRCIKNDFAKQDIIGQIYINLTINLHRHIAEKGLSISAFFNTQMPLTERGAKLG